jgi:hypothetical protein
MASPSGPLSGRSSSPFTPAHLTNSRAALCPPASAAVQERRSLLLSSLSGATERPAFKGAVCSSKKKPRRNGAKLASLLHSLAGGHPAVSIMPGESMCSTYFKSPGASFGRTPAWRLGAWPRSRASDRGRAKGIPASCRRRGRFAASRPECPARSARLWRIVLSTREMDLWGTHHHGTLPSRTRWRSDRASEGAGAGRDESR